MNTYSPGCFENRRSLGHLYDMIIYLQSYILFHVFSLWAVILRLSGTYRIKFAFIFTSTAFDTFSRVDEMGFFPFADDCIYRTIT